LPLKRSERRREIC